MATLGELKTRIILEVDRDDLGPGGEAEQALIDACTDAIAHYADQVFWFNRASGSVDTAAGIPTLAMPVGVRFPTSVAWLGELLAKASLSELEHRTETGTPSHWAGSGDAIRLWPIPDGTYTLSVHGLASDGVPASDGESTVWTNEGARLIVARAKASLFRMLKEYDAMQAAQAEEAEALSRLRTETRARDVSPLRTDLPLLRATFNIQRGW